MSNINPKLPKIPLESGFCGQKKPRMKGWEGGIPHTFTPQEVRGFIPTEKHENGKLCENHEFPI